MTGTLDVLNIGSGHLTFSFDNTKPDEVEKAKKVLLDMLKRGYMIFVIEGKEQRRVTGFDSKLNEYIINDPVLKPSRLPPFPDEPLVMDEEPIAAPVPNPKQPRSYIKRRIAAGKANATAIGPSAGG